MRPETRRIWERSDLTSHRRSKIWKGNKKRWKRAQRTSQTSDPKQEPLESRPTSGPKDFSSTNKKPGEIESWPKFIGIALIAFVSFVGSVATAYQIAGVENVLFAHLILVIGWLGFVSSFLLLERVLALPRRRIVKLTIGVAVVSGLLMIGMDRLMVYLKAHQKGGTAQESNQREIIQRLASDLEREKLLRSYPLGYAIFYVDHEEKVIPYDAEFYSAYELDWSAVKLTQHREFGTVSLALPTLREKGAPAQSLAAQISLYGPRRVGLLSCSTAVPDSKSFAKALTVCGEILAIRGETVVFLIGVRDFRVPVVR